MRQAIPFGKYLLLDRISVGGMAEVFKAKSYGVEGFEKVIAIKRILPSMGEDREFIKMFIDEAKIVGQLAHANICQIFELGRTDGAHFIAMEYIWGKDLLQIQNRARKLKQQMPVTMACFIVAKTLEGLDYAHKKRDALGRPLEIVHRDCSPQNVLISYEGEVKIIDFGIAKAASRSSKTQAGVLKGKFGYMSPEQVRGLPLDRRSDVFAAGTILYECLSGDRLFVGETDFSTLEKVRNVDIPRPRDVNPAIPEAVERIILKALAKDSSDRYQWGSEMVGDLQRFLMSQDQVFTAKTLATWLKEGFAAEVDRERQQHESFKKLGREGLIAGVPQAEAKLDVVEHLGQAGQAEDPTVLGGPSFEDMVDEHGAAVGPAPGSPAARGDNPEEFAEEGPTEIFGEISEVAAAPGAPTSAAAVVVAANARRAQTANARPPPSGPPSRPAMAAAPPPPMARSEEATLSPLGSPLAPVPMAAHQGASTAGMPAPSSNANARTMLGMQAPVIPQQPTHPPGHAAGAPGGLPAAALPLSSPPTGQNPAQSGFPSPDQFPLGSQPPYGAGGPQGQPYGAGGPQGQPGQPYGAQGQPPYGAGPGGYPQAPGGPSYGYLGPSASQPNDPYAQGGGPGGPGGPGGYPSGQQFPSNQGYSGDPSAQGYPPGAGYPSGGGYSAEGYPSGNNYPSGQGFGPYGGPSAAQQAPVDATGKRRKKPSLAKDVLIGIGIAAIVLGAFAIVKFVVMADKPAAKTAATVAVGSIDVALSDDGAAEVFIDDVKRGDAAAGKLSVGELTPGPHQLRIARVGAIPCETQVEIAAGQAKPVPCELKPDPAIAAEALDAGVDESGDAGAAIGDAGADAAAAIDATIDAALPVATAGSGSGSGSDAVAAIVGSKPEDDPTGSGSGSGRRSDRGSGSGSAKPTGSGSGSGSGTSSRIDLSGGSGSDSAKPTGGGSGSGSAKPAAGSEGFLVAYTTPFAALTIDGVATGKTTPIGPRAKIPLSPGLHKVVFKVGSEMFGFTVKIETGKNTTISKDLPVKQQ